MPLSGLRKTFEGLATGDLWASLLMTDSWRYLPTLYPQAVGMCVKVVQLVYKAAGGGAVYRKGPLDRCLRDILTANRQVVATARTYEMAGRLLLGLEPLKFLLQLSVEPIPNAERLGRFFQWHSRKPWKPPAARRLAPRRPTNRLLSRKRRAGRPHSTSPRFRSMIPFPHMRASVKQDR
jgi:hypothetical protein